MANQRHQDHVSPPGGEHVDVRAEEMRDHDTTVRGTVTTHSPVGAQPVRVERSTSRMADGESPDAYMLTRDRVHWGPIIAGLLTALTTLLLLSLLGLAIGLSSVDAGAAARGAAPPDAGRNAAIWGAISGIIAFLLGGYVAGRTAAVFDRNWGMFNGAMVFLLAVPLTLLLAGLGLGGILGTLGNFAGGMNVDAGQVQQATATVQPADAQRAAEAVRNSAWGALLGGLLGLAASAIGGMLGTRKEVDVLRPAESTTTTTTRR
jgi:hypothetical protein